MGLPVISYHGKSISLPKPPFDYRVEPWLPRKVNVALTGIVETIRGVRVDNLLHFAWRETSLTVAIRRQLDNLNQWAQQGNAFSLAFDSATSVSTTLNGGEGIGETSIAVANGTGVVNGQQYVIKGGPNYQLVNVASGGGTNTIIIDTGLDFTFASGSVFRDRFLWDLIFRDERAMILFNERPASQTVNAFDWTLDAYEVEV